MTYSPAYSDSTNGAMASVAAGTSDGTSEITNTLKPKTIKVYKQWIDGGFTGDADSLHYEVELQLDMEYADNDYSDDSKIIALGDGAYAEYTVPMYTADGKLARYTVTETNQKYGYVPGGDHGQEFEVTSVGTDEKIITNTLPHTTLYVDKNWNDFENTYDLRPQSIKLKVQRSVDGTVWTDVTAGEISDAGSDNKVTITKPATDNGVWSRTFADLLKCDEDNNLYYYRVVEDGVKAYDTFYKRRTEGEYSQDLAEQLSPETPVDASLSYDIENKLITGDVTITKVWDDPEGIPDDMAKALHYAIRVELEKYSEKNGQRKLDYSIDKDGDGNALTIAKDAETGLSKPLVVHDVPVYDSEGNPILYIIKEDDQHYKYELTDTTPTLGGTHPDYPDKPYYDSYKLTNTLTLTKITAEKIWDTGYPANRVTPGQVRVKLTGREEDSGVFTSLYDFETDTLPIPAPASGSDTASVTFENLLMYSYGNKLLTYKVEELNPSSDYAVGYPVETVEAQANETAEHLRISNTTKKGSADFTKYDGSYNGSQYGYNITVQVDRKTVSGAEFGLYVGDGTGDGTPVSVTETAENSYTYAPDRSGTAVIKTGTDGRIHFRDLTPNTYYLKETKAPEGYELNTEKYVFTISGKTNDTGCTATYTGGSEITNTEILSRLTLAKKDETSKEALKGAQFWLLRLIPKELNDKVAGTADMSDEDYIAAATAESVIDATCGTDDVMWKYWEKYRPYTTDEQGMIKTPKELVFGTYLFYEVQAPIGYERVIRRDAFTIKPKTADEANAVEDEENRNLVGSFEFEDERSQANVRVLKTDENGKPLSGAKFDLYKVVEGGDDEKLNTEAYETDADGLTAEIPIADWGSYYFEETDPPQGYDVDSMRIDLTIGAAEAGQKVYIVRANDSRHRGSVEITKRAAKGIGAIGAGEALPGAEFNLFKKGSGAAMKLYHEIGTNEYIVAETVRDGEDYSDDTKYAPADEDIVTSSETGTKGKLVIKGLAWGDYVLRETNAPDGFKVSEEPMYFSIGRNNCEEETMQELTFTDDPQTAQLKLDKGVDRLNIAAWGEPTFIFNIRQTKDFNGVDLDPVRERKVTITINNETSKTGTTDWFDVEPGTYEITEVQVARYSFKSYDFITAEETGVTGKSSGGASATFTVAIDGKAEVRFENELSYMDKLSHVSARVNKVNGIKKIEVSYDGEATENGTVEKTALTVYKVYGDGSRVKMTADENADYLNALEVYQGVERIDTDESGEKKDTFTFAGESDKVYTFTAKDADGFSDTFTVQYAHTPLTEPKEIRVNFICDDGNKSYYLDKNGSADVRTSVYSYDFLLTCDTSNNTWNVSKIYHNGKERTEAFYFSTPQVYLNEMYEGKWQFKEWSYICTGESEETTAADKSDLIAVIKNLPDNAEMTVKAVLEPKP